MENVLGSLFGAAAYVPHGYCLLWRPELLALHAGSDALIAAAYFAIPFGMASLLRQRRDVGPQARGLAWLFVAFILACGLSHLLGVLTLWYPYYGIEGLVKAGTALVSVATAFVLWPLIPVLASIPSRSELEAVNARLTAEIESHVVTLRELEEARAELERRVESRTRELTETTVRFEAALRSSDVTVFSQDRDLRYTWISKAALGREPRDIVGLTDDDLIPMPHRERVIAIKREVIETGVPRDEEVSVRDRDMTRWFDLHVQPIRSGDGDITGVLCAAVEITERKEWEGQQRLLMRELSHRSKNLLAVVQAIARQTANHQEDIPGFLDRFGARLEALGRATDVMIAGSWRVAVLGDLVRSQLGHHLDAETPQVFIEGPQLELASETAQTLGLALHELATNAAKYGALSVRGGRVAVSWQVCGEEGEEAALVLSWTEQGGPLVKRPTRRGFGTVVIERNVARALGGEVQLDFAPTGLVCRMRIPASHILEREEPVRLAIKTG